MQLPLSDVPLESILSDEDVPLVRFRFEVLCLKPSATFKVKDNLIITQITIHDRGLLMLYKYW